MKFTSAAVLLAASAASARALPNINPRDAAHNGPPPPIDDTTILNYALTLEHLENAFYSGALAKYTKNDFVNDGLPVWARGRFVEIGEHEAAHVAFLSQVLGPNATQPCTYDFPYTSPSSFTALSAVLEGVGVSAYAGAAQFISSKEYLTAAAVVLSTEARHAAWVASAVNKQNPWSGPLDTPLSLNVVYTLAAQFITSCPPSNPKLPVKAFPSLTLSTPKAGKKSTVTAGDGVSTKGAYVVFFSGLSTLFVPVQNGAVVVPSTLMGTSYAVLTNSDSSATDADITAGVAVIQLPFDSNGNPE